MSSSATNPNTDDPHNTPIPVSTSTSSKPTNESSDHKNEPPSQQDGPGHSEHDNENEQQQQPHQPFSLPQQSPRRRSQASHQDSDSNSDNDGDDDDGDTERDQTENNHHHHSLALSLSPTPTKPKAQHQHDEPQRETTEGGEITTAQTTITTNDLKEELEPFDWKALEARFVTEMEECRRQEEALGEEFGGWVEVCVFFPSFFSLSPPRSSGERQVLFCCLGVICLIDYACVCGLVVQSVEFVDGTSSRRR